MDAYRAMRYAAFVVLVTVMAAGCEDDPQRPPPPPPPLPLELQMFVGLPDNEVYDILVDSQNRTWISTNGGVAMNDGSVTTTFDDFDGIPNRQCRGLAEHNGRIFVGTWGGGVAYYDGGPMWTALPVKEGSQSGVVNGRVFSIAVDDTSLWISTTGGISQYINDDSRPMNERWVDYSNEVGTTTVMRRGFDRFDQEKGPELWFATQDKGLAVLRLPSMRDVHGWVSNDRTDRRVFAVGDGGAVMEFVAATSSWRWWRSPRSQRLNAVAVVSKNGAHAVGNGGVALRFDGTNWRVLNSRSSRDLHGLYAAKPDSLIAVGDQGTLLRFAVGSWNNLISGTSRDLHGVWAINGRNVIAVGAGGTIIKHVVPIQPNVPFTEVHNSGTTADLNGIWGASRNEIFAVGEEGTILKFDSGTTWVPMDSPTTLSLTKVFGKAANDVWAVGEQGVILHYDGSSWSQTPSGAPMGLTMNGVWDSGAQAGNLTQLIVSVGSLSSHANGSHRFYIYDGSVWSRMTAGTGWFLDTSWVVESTSGLPDNDVTDLILDDQNDQAWMTMSTKGIASVDPPTKTWMHVSQVDGLGSDLCMALGRRSNGDLWVGTQTGISRREPTGRVTNFIKGSGLPDSRVRRVYVDRNDRVWLAFVEAGAGWVVDPDNHK